MADKASMGEAKMGAKVGGPVIPGDSGKPVALQYDHNGTFNGLNVMGGMSKPKVEDQNKGSYDGK